MNSTTTDYRPDDRLVTLPEAARLLGVSPDTLRRRVRSGALPTKQLGGEGRRYLSLAQVRQFLDT